MTYPDLMNEGTSMWYFILACFAVVGGVVLVILDRFLALTCEVLDPIANLSVPLSGGILLLILGVWFGLRGFLFSRKRGCGSGLNDVIFISAIIAWSTITAIVLFRSNRQCLSSAMTVSVSSIWGIVLGGTLLEVASLAIKYCSKKGFSSYDRLVASEMEEL